MSKESGQINIHRNFVIVIVIVIADFIAVVMIYNDALSLRTEMLQRGN